MGRTYNVIDADGHVLEPVDLWDTYIDPAYRDRAPRLFVDSDGKERLRVEGKVLGSPKGLGLIGAIGARQGAVSDATMKYVEGRKGGFDPHARIVDLDVDGIDAAFLYPSLGLFAGAIEDPKLAAAVCRAYNRWLADYCRPYPDRLFGVAMLPMQSVELAIEEMRYARRELGMRGGFLRPNPYNGRMLHHPDYAPFWAQVEELDFSFEPVEGSLSVLADYIRPNKVLWATEHPHPGGFFPGAADLIGKRPELSAETKRQILAGGAARFYALA